MQANGTRLVLLSGGPDSMVLAYRLAREGQPLRAAFLRHGRLRNARELVASQHVVRRLEIPLDIADLSGIRTLYAGHRPGAAAAVAEGGPPAVAAVIDGDGTAEEDTLSRHGLSPFSIMMTLALYFGHLAGCSGIYIGLISEQTRERPRFRQYLDALSQLDTVLNPQLPRLEIHTPQLEMSKAQVLSAGIELGAPLELSWSCLMGGETHCGTCSHCVSRRQGFQEIGVPDPTVYAA